MIFRWCRVFNMVGKDAHYFMCKGGVYYFTRHAPNDLQKHYEKSRIVMCLKIRSKNATLKVGHSFASKLDGFWLKMRVSNIEVTASNLLIIWAAINITIQEDGLSCTNALAKTYLLSEERPNRSSISLEDIKRVQKVCFDMARERRLLIALLSDTGKRLSQALRLVWSNVHLHHNLHISSLFRSRRCNWRPLAVNDFYLLLVGLLERLKSCMSSYLAPTFFSHRIRMKPSAAATQLRQLLTSGWKLISMKV